MSAGNRPVTRHCVRWGQHENLLNQWRRNPPIHPESPRYQGAEVEVEGRYSWFESAVNVLRRKGWLDAPPADFKWAIVTVYYEAPEDPTDRLFGVDAEPEAVGAGGRGRV